MDAARTMLRQFMPKRKRRLLAGIVFVMYFIVLFYFLFFSEEMGRTYSERAYHYNLVPFREIGRFIRYRHILGREAVMLNIVGNVAAFVPFGTFLPIFSVRCRRFFNVALFSFELSLCVETLQLIFKVGSFDVDDLILNTLGGIVGFCIYALGAHFMNKKGRQKGDSDGTKKA